MLPPMGRLLTILVLLLSPVACGGTQGTSGAGSGDEDPAVALDAWYEALEAGRTDKAWEMLDEEARQDLDAEAFQALYDSRRAQMIREAEALRRLVRERPAEERARVQIGDELLELVRTREGWRLSKLITPAPEAAEASGAQ